MDSLLFLLCFYSVFVVLDVLDYGNILGTILCKSSAGAAHSSGQQSGNLLSVVGHQEALLFPMLSGKSLLQSACYGGAQLDWLVYIVIGIQGGLCYWYSMLFLGSMSLVFYVIGHGGLCCDMGTLESSLRF